MTNDKDWKAAYDAVVADAREVYATVFNVLTDPEAPYENDQERMATAANEVNWAFKRLDARELFDASF